MHGFASKKHPGLVCACAQPLPLGQWPLLRKQNKRQLWGQSLCVRRRRLGSVAQFSQWARARGKEALWRRRARFLLLAGNGSSASACLSPYITPLPPPPPPRPESSQCFTCAQRRQRRIDFRPSFCNKLCARQSSASRPGGALIFASRCSLHALHAPRDQRPTRAALATLGLWRFTTTLTTSSSSVGTTESHCGP